LSTERFPADLVVTAEDFRNSGWRDAIEGEPKHGYRSYWKQFSNLSVKRIEEGFVAEGKVLWLLADACSMALNSESINEPFRPIMVLQEKRSAMPEDFLETDLDFFESILPDIDDFRLKARIADILWLVRVPRKVEYALAAMDSYAQFPLDDLSLLRNGREAWERAISLSRSLNKGAGDLLEKIGQTIFVSFDKADYGGRFHALWLSEFLEKAYVDEEMSLRIAIRLEEFAIKGRDDEDWNFARQYYEGALKWRFRANELSEAYRLYAEIAEAWVSEAEERASGENPSNMTAGHLFECAIQGYRKIPKKERGTFKADERIAELHSRMNNANKLALDEMIPFEMPGVDIGEAIEASRAHVAGRKFPEVLLAVAGLYHGIKVDEIRAGVEKRMEEFLYNRLFGKTLFTKDGRVASKAPAVGSNDDSPEKQKAIWQEMINHYGMQIGLIVQAQIIPAVQVVCAEHRINARTLVSLCRSARIIPPGREVLWAKGLFFGFEGNFSISTHLLIPQLEHLVRVVLKDNEIKTTTLDSRGIETENGLGTLLDIPEIEGIIGKDLYFEFQALLTDPSGPNLRNNMAHGLLDDEHSTSAYAVYLWWFCLRLVVNTVQWETPDFGKENEA